MKQVKDKYTSTTLEQMPEHKLFRALMSELNDFGFDCKAFAAPQSEKFPDTLRTDRRQAHRNGGGVTENL